MSHEYDPVHRRYAPPPPPKTDEERQLARTRMELRVMLSLAVPLWLQRFKDERRTLSDLLGEAPRCADEVAEKGDVLQFGGKGCKDAFNALAKGLAICSFVPGGIRFCGVHFQSDPAWLAEAA